ncbi:MAG: DUF2835 domain-containing protein [Gammaproteobacteria bacterium]|nr:DUF2835 domain-containing protein [Gammaproteobacteria bacterium]
MHSHSIRFRLAIPADDYLAYYKGQIRDVVVRAADGRRIQFPANALQGVVSHQGIYGLFELRFDAQNKLLGLHRVGE